MVKPINSAYIEATYSLQVSNSALLQRSILRVMRSRDCWTRQRYWWSRSRDQRQRNSKMPIDLPVILGISFLVVFVGMAAVLVATRYKRCPSDRILVVYGRVGGKGAERRSARCYHGGAAFIVPVFQSFEFLDLTPTPIEINLQGALSQQNIRINTPSTFTVGISTEAGVMENAAERLLGLPMTQIRELARDIIFGQMRVVIATMTIEEINTDREQLIEKIFSGVEVELNKVGLHLISVNIQASTAL